MKLYAETKEYKLFHGSMLDMLEVIKPNSIDSIVTDPPYELNFMNKGWDNSGIAFRKDTWRKCYEVLKPGGYLLAFGGSRTFHRIAVAIEDAGFEIRDTIMWLYGSGFPKSMNIGLMIDKAEGVESEIVGQIYISGSPLPNNHKGTWADDTCDGWVAKKIPASPGGKKYKGYGTTLKPAFEPIIVARKPVENSVVSNMLKYGVGGINIDGCRVGDDEEKNNRYPSNVILTYDETDFDEVCGKMSETLDNSSNACRYFYCAKASKKDRDDGLQAFKQRKVNDGRKKPIDNAFQRAETPRRNVHPTVKPTELMQYLVRLVSPPGATILDCFNGSGSTGKAVMYENKERGANYKYIGIELTDEYLPIAKARIEYAANDFDISEEVKTNDGNGVQLSLFDEV